MPVKTHPGHAGKRLAQHSGLPHDPRRILAATGLAGMAARIAGWDGTIGDTHEASYTAPATELTSAARRCGPGRHMSPPPGIPLDLFLLAVPHSVAAGRCVEMEFAGGCRVTN